MARRVFLWPSPFSPSNRTDPENRESLHSCTLVVLREGSDTQNRVKALCITSGAHPLGRHREKDLLWIGACSSSLSDRSGTGSCWNCLGGGEGCHSVSGTGDSSHG